MGEIDRFSVFQYCIEKCIVGTASCFGVQGNSIFGSLDKRLLHVSAFKLLEPCKGTQLDNQIMLSDKIVIKHVSNTVCLIIIYMTLFSVLNKERHLCSRDTYVPTLCPSIDIYMCSNGYKAGYFEYKNTQK